MTLWLVPLLPMLAGIAIAAFGPQSRRALAAISGGVLAATLILAVLAVAGGWTGALDWGGGIALTAGTLTARFVNVTQNSAKSGYVSQQPGTRVANHALMLFMVC